MDASPLSLRLRARPSNTLLAALTAAAALGSLAPRRADAQAFIHPYGYMQPLVRWSQQDANPNVIDPQTSGFSVRRARIGLNGGYIFNGFRLEAQFEVDLTPTVQLLDGWIALSRDLVGKGWFQLRFGQQLTPFSRQYMTSAWLYQMIDYSLIAGSSVMPQRQIGLQAQFNVPYAPWLELSGGIYNGEGINVVQNVDKNFMFIGRLAVRPFSPRAPVAESGFGPTQLSIAFNAMYNSQTIGSVTDASGNMVPKNQNTLLVGGDVFGAWRGASLYGEFIWGRVTYSNENGGVLPSCYAPNASITLSHCLRGFNAQAGYLLPIPGYLYRRFEVAARFEEYEPNARVVLTGPGDPNQTRGSVQAIVNYFQFQHALKLQLAYLHNFQISKLDQYGHDATYHDDAVILQATVRLWL